MPSQDERERHHEGPEAARRFEHTMNCVLRVSKKELTKREAAYQERRRAKKTQPKTKLAKSSI